MPQGPLQNPVEPQKQLSMLELKTSSDITDITIHKGSSFYLSHDAKSIALKTIKKFIKEIRRPDVVPETLAFQYLKQFNKASTVIITIKQAQQFLPNLNVTTEKKLLTLFGFSLLEAKGVTFYYFRPYQYILALMVNSITYSDLDKRIEFAFMMYDHDDDGMITKADLKEMLSVYGKEGQFRMTESTVENIVEGIFANIYGSKGTEDQITLSEFKEFFKNESFVPIKVDIFERRRASLNGANPEISKDPSPNQNKSPSKICTLYQNLKNKYYIDGVKKIWLTLFFFGLLYYGITTFISYYNKSHMVAVGVAKGSAAVIKYSLAFLLALVTKTLTTILRKIGLVRLLPLNFNVYFHTILGVAVFIASWAHSIAHMGFIMRKFSNIKDLEDLNKLLRTPTYRVHPYTWWVFQSIPGWTGIVSLILITLLCFLAVKKIRNTNFEVFKYSHALWIVIIILLCFHGYSEFLGANLFFLWIIFPTSVLMLERVYAWSLLIFNKRHKIVNMKYLADSDIIELEVSKPQGYTFIPGQYVDLKIPQISLLQWHPFSFSGSPNEETLKFHISPVGDWTNDLKNIVLNSKKLPQVLIRGPFGTPSQHYSQYKNLMVIGTGVGATPFASIMRDFIYKEKLHSTQTKSFDFYWINKKPTSNTWLSSLFKELLSNEEVKKFIKIRMFFTNPQQRYDLRYVLLWRGLEILHQNGVKINGLELFDLMHWGRPDWDEVFQNKIKEIKRGTVGVFFCGNNRVAKELHQKCLKYSGKVVFKFNKEVI